MRRQHPITHIEHAGKPFCGVPIGEPSFFVSCLNGVHHDYVDCGSCRIKYKAHLQGIIDAMMRSYLEHKPHKVTIDERDDDNAKVA